MCRVDVLQSKQIVLMFSLPWICFAVFYFMVGERGGNLRSANLLCCVLLYGGFTEWNGFIKTTIGNMMRHSPSLLQRRIKGEIAHTISPSPHVIKSPRAPPHSVFAPLKMATWCTECYYTKLSRSV